MKDYLETVDFWKSLNVKSEADIDNHLDNFKILFAYHSGKIENDDINYIHTKEIFDNGKVINFSGNVRTLFELQNQKLCYGYFKSKLAKKEILSIPLIKEIHQILAAGTYIEKKYFINGERPGEFKKHDYVTGEYEVGSPANEVEKDLEELILEIYDGQEKNIIKVAAYFHLKFEYIFPFAGSNGRVGRALLNYYLLTNNHPPLIIFNEDSEIYYKCLREYDISEEIMPMINFLKDQTVKTWIRQMNLSKGIKSERKTLENY